MKAIYKYPIAISDIVTLDLPIGAKVLSFQNQNGIPCLWALVDPEKPTVPRRFRLLGTGHHFKGPTGTFIGTVQLNGGSLVFHLFEVE